MSTKKTLILQLLLVSLFILFANSNSNANEKLNESSDTLSPKLKGPFVQGALIRGTIAPSAKVFLNGNELKVTRDGDFVFGLGRDAALRHELRWEYNGTTQQRTITIEKRKYDIQKIEGVAQKYVSPPKSVLERIRADNRKIAKARSFDSDFSYFTQDFLRPSEGRISGVYGSQRVFNGEPKRPHYGLDIANKIGTPVKAPIDGIVRLAHEDMYYSGGTIIVDHGLGVSSTYIHLSKILVNAGDKVSQGDIIGEIGNTGRVTGPHLDWRLNWFKERLDPALLIE